MSQTDFFTAKYEAIAQADDHADQQWRHDAFEAVMWCARMRPTFTADDVWGRIESSTHEPAALGPVFLRAKNAGLIKPTGEYRPSKSARRHRDLKVWRAA